jgi:hypothetical protein
MLFSISSIQLVCKVLGAYCTKKEYSTFPVMSVNLSMSASVILTDSLAADINKDTFRVSFIPFLFTCHCYYSGFNPSKMKLVYIIFKDSPLQRLTD